MKDKVKEYSIIFSDESVIAILAGRKTQTRRVVTAWNENVFKCPYGDPGDRLWVREEWAMVDDKVIYRADSGADASQRDWRPALTRAASRLTLEVTRVRVERLQEITLEDINLEGTPDTLDPRLRPFGTRREQYQRFWDSLNAKRGYAWDKNPWVWVVEFKVVPK
jgi:hypothetical protein